jgi:hypothetical protein
MTDSTGNDASTRRPRKHRGDHRTDRIIESVARTMAAMEAGQCSMQTLDTMSSPLAARRIHKQVLAAKLARESSGSRTRTEPMRILSTRSMHPSAGVTEGVVVVQVADRVRAFCVRLEQEAQHWRLVDLASPETDLNPAVTEASRTGAVPVDEDGVRRSSGGRGAAFALPPLPGDPVLPIEDEDQPTDERD